MNNPYSPTKAPVVDTNPPKEAEVEYAGFWIRVAASIIDSVLVGIVTAPLLLWVYGFAYFDTDKLIRGPAEVLISYVLPAIAIVIFWVARSATPGKMLLSIKIVDADTFGPIGTGKAIGRYLGYFLSTIPLCLGLFWVGWNARKQGWHDMLAGTVVIQGR